MTVDPLGKILSSGFLRSSDMGAFGHLGLANDCTQNVLGERDNLLVMRKQHSSILLPHRACLLQENKPHINQCRFFFKRPTVMT